MSSPGSWIGKCSRRWSSDASAAGGPTTAQQWHSIEVDAASGDKAAGRSLNPLKMVHGQPAQQLEITPPCSLAVFTLMIVNDFDFGNEHLLTNQDAINLPTI